MQHFLLKNREEILKWEPLAAIPSKPGCMTELLGVNIFRIIRGIIVTEVIVIRSGCILCGGDTPTIYVLANN